MALKIISLIFVISLAFGIQNPTRIKDVLFDVNKVINRDSQHAQNSAHQPLTFELNDEFMIDTSIIYVGAQSYQSYPTVSFDGTNYLVVWEDRRKGSNDIYGARVSQAGIVLDPTGITISNAAANQESPVIAFDGVNYLVVWTDYRNGPADIYGTRVSLSGTVLNPNGIIISTAAYDQCYPAITFDGTNYLVVWEDLRHYYYWGFDIYGTRISPSGTVLDPEGIPISPMASDQCNPSITFNGTNYLVVWEDYRSMDYSDIYGTRVSQTGIVLDPNGFIVSIAVYDQRYPKVASDGMNFLAVWEDERYGRDIYGARISQDGTVLDSTGITISTNPDDQESPNIIFGDSNYLVAWQDNRSGSYEYNIYGARLSQSGIVLDSNGFIVSSTASYNPSIIFDSLNFLIVWEDYRPLAFSDDIYAARISQANSVLDSNGIVISTVTNYQKAPSIAFDGTNYLVVWQDYRNGCYADIYGALLTQTGNMLDTVAISISTALYSQQSPAIAFGGANYLVAWLDHRNGYPDNLFCARVSQNGTVLDPDGICISTTSSYQSVIDIAFDGINYLVIWTIENNERDIYGARVSPAGTVLDPNGFVISNRMNDQLSPCISFDGINYLVVWEERLDYQESDIYGTRVSQAGIVLDPDGFVISAAPLRQQIPAIDFDGTNYLVVWQDYRWISNDIFGARVSPAGVVIDSNGIVISSASGDRRYPSVAYTGEDYLIVWEDGRNGSYFDLYGVRVSTAGILTDSFKVSVEENNQNLPALARGANNRVLITFQGWTEEYQGGDYQAIRIWGKFYPFIGIEEENSKVKIQSAKLLEVYPNPAKGVVRVRYLPPGQDLKIYNATGRLVKSFWFEPIKDKRVMPNEIIWNGTDDSGKKLPAGVYLCRLKAADGSTETKEIIIMR